VAHPWHPGHDTTLTPANPWTDRPMCHSLATLPGHRRATHAPAWPSLARRPLLRRGSRSRLNQWGIARGPGRGLPAGSGAKRQEFGVLASGAQGPPVRGSGAAQHAGCPHQKREMVRGRWFGVGATGLPFGRRCFLTHRFACLRVMRVMAGDVLAHFYYLSLWFFYDKFFKPEINITRKIEGQATVECGFRGCHLHGPPDPVAIGPLPQYTRSHAARGSGPNDTGGWKRRKRGGACRGDGQEGVRRPRCRGGPGSAEFGPFRPSTTPWWHGSGWRRMSGSPPS